MLILLNAETVIHEVLTVARHRIARVLEIPPEWVIVRIVPRDGRIHPEVELDVPATGVEFYPNAKLYRQSKELTVERIGQVMGGVRSELSTRLEGIKKVL